jgi:formate hydrogenlyase subunit 7
MSTLLGPRDENGIPVPMTVDESIASMKASLLKKIKRSAYVYRVDCGGCNGCEIEIFATLSPLFDAERFGIKVVPSPRHADILLFTGAVTRAMRSRRCAPGSRRRIRKSVSPTAPAATAAASSTTCTASGAAPIKSYRWMSIFRAARRRPPPRCTASPWRSACWSRKSTPVCRASSTNSRPSCCTRYGAAAAGAHRPRSAASGGLSLWPPDCRRLYAPAGQGDSQVLRWLEAEKDPRLTEIVTHLNQVVEGRVSDERDGGVQSAEP